jgi:hypothetical protein
VAAGRTSTSPPTTTAPATTGTTAAASSLTGVEREVEVAYLQSWEVYADAVLRLDASRLEEGYSGAALEVRRDEVAGLAEDGTPIRVAVEHDYEIAVLNEVDAFVFEDYFNHSVLLDGRTMQPIEADPNEVVRREYVLRKERSGWRVAHINAVS